MEGVELVVVLMRLKYPLPGTDALVKFAITVSFEINSVVPGMGPRIWFENGSTMHAAAKSREANPKDRR